MSKKVYDNRELSWLKFNKRVLEEAQDSEVPLMERLKFASIYGSNLDEFFMVRVGTLIDQKLADDSHKDGKTKMRPSEQLSAIYSQVRKLNGSKDKTIDAVQKELELKGVFRRTMKSLSRKELEFAAAYYDYEIKPFLNALIIDKRHPFPFLGNQDIYVVTKILSKSDIKLGLISCKDKFKRVIFLPSGEDEVHYLLAEDLILYYSETAFESYKVEEKALMRITRNADIDMDECYDSELDFRQNMSALISRRRRLRPIRLQLSRNVSDLLLDELLSRLELSKKQCFVERSPLDMGYVFPLAEKAADRSELFFRKAEPQPSRMIKPDIPMLQQVDEGDILLSYPYEAMTPFIRLLNEAALDPEVTSIKMTLYRVARNSRIVKALCTAAENGKEVVVLVELRARFDEENNIGWSKLLEESGCHVIYGPQGLKVHSKLCLITRKTKKGVKYCTQVGTGNFNEKTAKQYTDLALITANPDFAADVEIVFRSLALGEPSENSGLLWFAPHSLQNRILEMMNNEIAVARAGGKGYVGAKINSLTDKLIIDKLIECSQAGVKVELVIRGISCLVAGVEGVTDNIRIVSIVGRFLEHSRIYIFGSGARKSVYISSADYMTRNTIHRVEAAAPILDEAIKQRVIAGFELLLSDNVKAREQQPDGRYRHVRSGELPIDSQKILVANAYANAPGRDEIVKPKPFDPAETEKAAEFAEAAENTEITEITSANQETAEEEIAAADDTTTGILEDNVPVEDTQAEAIENTVPVNDRQRSVEEDLAPAEDPQTEVTEMTEETKPPQRLEELSDTAAEASEETPESAPEAEEIAPPVNISWEDFPAPKKKKGFFARIIAFFKGEK